MKKLLDSFLEIFRKKEYYLTCNEILNAFGISFKVIDSQILQKIQEAILNLGEADAIYDSEFKAKKVRASEFQYIETALSEVKNIVNQDYRETYFEAINHNWEFTYYVSGSHAGTPNVIIINNELRKEGSVVYSILAIKKFRGKYYIWNFLE